VTGEHRRHLATSVRYIARLLDEAGEHLPLLADSQAMREALRIVRNDMGDFSQRFQLDVRAPAVDPTHAIRVQLSLASISVTEMRSRSMRGYGPLGEDEARELDASCDVLESAIDRAHQILDGV